LAYGAIWSKERILEEFRSFRGIHGRVDGNSQYIDNVQITAGEIPLTQLLGVGKSLPDDWKQTQVAWIFSLAIVMLGVSAAFGKWLEEAGPRKAMFAAAVCFALGFYVSYLGVTTHQLWLIYVGYGVIGGTGLGLGYISPVSTLTPLLGWSTIAKHFEDLLAVVILRWIA
jgi:MFS family permease